MGAVRAGGQTNKCEGGRITLMAMTKSCLRTVPLQKSSDGIALTGMPLNPKLSCTPDAHVTVYMMLPPL